MRARRLFPDYTGEDFDVTKLTSDSRTVYPGDLFFALPSLTSKNTDSFVLEALNNGAKAIVALPSVCDAFSEESIPFISSPNPRLDLARVAAAFYPSKPKHISAVTGTNGKSSIVDFVRQILHLNNIKVVSIGTIGAFDGFGDKLQESTLTSPDTVGLHEFLAELKEAEVTHVSMEASSHGLDQHRLDYIPISVAAFTNLTHEHLDYHHTMENYFNAKTRLFTELLMETGTAVINIDSDYGTQLEKICAHRRIRTITYGHKSNCDIQVHSVVPTPTGQEVDFIYREYSHKVTLPLVGAFQAENVACAIGICLGYLLSEDQIFSKLAHLNPVLGRMEHVAHLKKDADVFIDYAHTPDALETVLRAIRPHTRKNLVVLFGCGGDRDTAKRPIMGKIASRYADRIYITDDNPRTEDPSLIREAIKETCPNGIEIENRREALKIALQGLDQGDVLVVAGKGHETVQIIGHEILPFNEHSILKSYIEECNL